MLRDLTPKDPTPDDAHETAAAENADVTAAVATATTIYVCITCRNGADFDLVPTPGAVLAAATLRAAEGTGITVRGVLEGTLAMDGCRLVIEAGGTVSADVNAGSVAVCNDGTLTGKVRAASFVVDDGANFNGQIELITR